MKSEKRNCVEIIFFFSFFFFGNFEIFYTGMMLQNREKQEIKTVRIVKRESERRQRDRGDRTGNIGIPLTNGLQIPGGAKRLSDEDFGSSNQFEVRKK